MLFSQPCRSSHWMWCSMYRWNIHWLACSTRLVGNHDVSIYVCSRPKMRFPTISALWKLVLLYSFGGDNMGLLVLFCLNVTDSTRSILPFAVSLFGQLRGCFLRLRSMWFEKKFSPLIFFLLDYFFCFLFYHLLFGEICYWISCMIVMEKTICIISFCYFLSLQLDQSCLLFSHKFYVICFGRMNVCQSPLLLYNPIPTGVLSCQSFQKVMCIVFRLTELDFHIGRSFCLLRSTTKKD